MYNLTVSNTKPATSLEAALRLERLIGLTRGLEQAWREALLERAAHGKLPTRPVTVMTGKLGELAFRQATAGLKLRQSGLDAAAVKEIGSRLTKGSKYTYQWYIAEDAAINAFAIPGGYVVVNTGLIQAADSAEEVAGVLAHEVQHVELRHTLKNLVHSLGLRAALALALGDISGGALGDVAATLSELKFSRDLESEADQRGLAALRQASIAPQGMVTFFSKLHKQEKGAAPPALLSTHPASDNRMRTLQDMIGQQGNWPAQPLPYDWTAIKATAR